MAIRCAKPWIVSAGSNEEERIAAALDQLGDTLLEMAAHADPALRMTYKLRVH